MQKQFPISVAKNKLPAIVHNVEHGKAVQFTRHGKPVAVLVSFLQYQELTKQKKGFWSALNDFKKSFHEKEDAIKDGDFAGLRDPDQGRDVIFK